MKSKNFLKYLIMSLIFSLSGTMMAQDFPWEPGSNPDDGPSYGENGISYYILQDEYGEKYASTAFVGTLEGDYIIPV